MRRRARPEIAAPGRAALPLWLVCGILLAPATRAAGGPGPLSIDTLLGLSTFSLYSNVGALSADGARLAYAVRRCSPENGEGAGFHGASGLRAGNEGCSDLWVVETKSGASRRLTENGLAEDAAWSPDGSRLAFYANLDGTPGLWIWDRAAGTSRRAGRALVRPSILDDGARIRWMPDGRSVVALVLPEGLTVAEANARAVDAPKAAPETAGSKVVVFRSDPHDTPRAEARSAGGIQRETSVLAKLAMAEIALIDADTGATRRLVPEKAIFWYAPSPDGRSIAYAHMTGFHQGWNARVYDVEVVSAAGGAPRVLARDAYPDQGFCSWSPDGARLAYATGQESDAVADVRVFEVSSGREEKIVREIATPTALWKNELAPLWAADGKTLAFVARHRLWTIPAAGGTARALTPAGGGLEIQHLLADPTGNQALARGGGRKFLVTTRNGETKEAGFFEVDRETGAMTKQREEPKDYAYASPLASTDGSTVVFRSQDEAHPPEIWAAGALADARAITRINPGIEATAFGSARLIDYAGKHGERLRGALLVPPGFHAGAPVPLVVQVYPGEYHHADQIHRFGFGDTNGPFNMQMLATRGYAVLFPETPQEVGTPASDLAETANAAIDRAVALGVADPNRLAVFGHSYGGFSALSLITRTDRFRAAVMSGGFGDLFAFYGELQDSGLDAWTGWVEKDGGMGGPPWAYRDRYIENSPIFHLDRVRTPLLILHGKEDQNVRVTYARQVFSYLRKLGLETEMREYPGEGHVVQARDSVADYWNAVMRWFERHLAAGGESRPAAGKEKRSLP